MKTVIISKHYLKKDLRKAGIPVLLPGDIQRVIYDNQDYDPMVVVGPMDQIMGRLSEAGYRIGTLTNGGANA